MIEGQVSTLLGAVVQPKTKEPVWVFRKEATYRTCEIKARGRYDIYLGIGEGYLDGGDMGDEYLNSVEITGFPRAHTPGGVRTKGGGYGTCLYTGLVLVASAIEDKQIQGYSGSRYARGMPGSGYGISSDSESRSESASEWWEAALKRGLTEQESGDRKYGGDETETETMDDEDLFDYMSARKRREIREAIVEAVQEYGDGWSPTSVSLKGDLEREVEASGGWMTADYYTLDSAREHRLIAYRTAVAVEDMEMWAKNPDTSGELDKEIILALNVSTQTPIVVGKLAALALKAGATEAEVTAMVLRNRFGLDLLGRGIGVRPVSRLKLGHTFEDDGMREAGVLLEDPRETEQREARERALDMLARAGTATPNPARRRRRRRVPMRELPPLRMVPNPPPQPSRGEQLALDREADALARRRDNLGWTNLEDLP